jgi:hypothetical protein
VIDISLSNRFNPFFSFRLFFYFFYFYLFAVLMFGVFRHHSLSHSCPFPTTTTPHLHRMNTLSRARTHARTRRHMVDSYSFPFVSTSYPELSAKGAWHSTAVYVNPPYLDSQQAPIAHRDDFYPLWVMVALFMSDADRQCRA